MRQVPWISIMNTFMDKVIRAAKEQKGVTLVSDKNTGYWVVSDSVMEALDIACAKSKQIKQKRVKKSEN